MLKALDLNGMWGKFHVATEGKYMARAARSCFSTHFLGRSLVEQVTAALHCYEVWGKLRWKHLRKFLWWIKEFKHIV